VFITHATHTYVYSIFICSSVIISWQRQCIQQKKVLCACVSLFCLSFSLTISLSLSSLRNVTLKSKEFVKDSFAQCRKETLTLKKNPRIEGTSDTFVPLPSHMRIMWQRDRTKCSWARKEFCCLSILKR